MPMDVHFSPPGTSTPGPSKPGMNAVEYTTIVEEPGSEISIMSGNDLKKTLYFRLI